MENGVYQYACGEAYVEKVPAIDIRVGDTIVIPDDGGFATVAEIEHPPREPGDGSVLRFNFHQTDFWLPCVSEHTRIERRRLLN